MSESKNQSLIAPYTSIWDYEISIQKKMYGVHAAQSHMHKMSSYINVINKNTNYTTPAMVNKQTQRHICRERGRQEEEQGEGKRKIMER